MSENKESSNTHDEDKKPVKDDALNLENIQVENELDRFLDIFKRVKAEQEVDELRKRLEQLVQNQDNIDEQIRKMDNETNSSNFKRLQAKFNF